MSPRSLRAQQNNHVASFLPASINLDDRTIDVVWSTGERVLRTDATYGRYYEELSLAPEHIRLDRFNSGAPVLNYHKDDDLFNQIGVVVRAWVEAGVGYATIRFSKRRGVEPIWQDVIDGIFRNISVGYKIYRAIETQQESDHPILRAIDTEFFELSLVSINADAKAQVRSAGANEHTLCLVRSEDMEREGASMEAAEASGDASLSQGETAVAKNTPPLANQEAGGTRGLVDGKTHEIALQERTRIRAVETLCRKHSVGVELTASLVDEGASTSVAKERILEELAKRSQQSMIQNQGNRSQIVPGERDEIATRRQGIANAILYNHNQAATELIEPAKPYLHRTLIDIIRMDLEARGERASSYSRSELVTRAFHSSSDFPIIMGELAHAKIVQSYTALMKKQTFTPLVRYENATNFKPMRRIQMGEIPSLERIPEGAEVTYGTISEHDEQWAIGSYGKAFTIGRETVINDEHGLILSAMEQWGAAVSRLESNLVWGLFKQNAKKGGAEWFSEAHGNTSKPAPLSMESLEEAEYMMSIQRGHDQREGDELNIIPEFLIVPSRLKNLAHKLIYGAYQPITLDTVNLYHNQFKVISEARLNPDKGQPYPWYLACDPSTLPVIWMAYLDGKRAPTVAYDTDFNTRAIKVRADIDFGVTTGDWRAVHKNPGVKRQGE